MIWSSCYQIHLLNPVQDGATYRDHHPSITKLTCFPSCARDARPRRLYLVANAQK